ncbi:MAG: hypothetical protein ACLFSJ_03565 [Halorhodospira sp.]
MDRGVVLVLIVVGLLALLTVSAGSLVSAPIAASWPAWWPVWSGFALIALAAVYAAWRRPGLARVTALRAVIAWLAWAAPALVYAGVDGPFGLPRLGREAWEGQGPDIGHWLERVTAYSLLEGPPLPDPVREVGATLALLVVYAAPVLAVFLLWSLWRSARRVEGG